MILRLGTAGAIFNSTHGHLGQNHSKEGAPIELKMAPAVPKHKITHVDKFSAQLKQLCESFSLNAIGF